MERSTKITHHSIIEILLLSMAMFTTGFLRAELPVGDNVLYNADMSIPGGDGTPLGWYFRYPRLSDAEIKVRSCGTGVAELFFDGQERMFVVQNHLTLHPKGKALYAALARCRSSLQSARRFLRRTESSPTAGGGSYAGRKRQFLRFEAKNGVKPSK